jgi:hypothetical protein
MPGMGHACSTVRVGIQPPRKPPDDRAAMLAALREALEYATFPLPPEYATAEDRDEREARINALWVRWFGKAPE